MLWLWAHRNLWLHKGFLLPREESAFAKVQGWVFFSGSAIGSNFLIQVQLSGGVGGGWHFITHEVNEKSRLIYYIWVMFPITW